MRDGRVKKVRYVLLCLFSIFIAGPTAIGAGTPLNPKDANLPKLQMPVEFAMVFSFGYVSDLMPKDPNVFETMLENMKRTGINTVHCKYADWRLELCEKHGVMMLIDLAVPEHDAKWAKCEPEEATDIKNLDGAEETFAAAKAELDKLTGRLTQIAKEMPAAPETRKAELEKEKQELESRKPALEKRKAVLIASNLKYICRKVRGSKGVWGYGLYYDNGTNGSHLNHAVEKLRLWDPTHVTFVGSYRNRGLETVTINPGCYGWYDFPWQRGMTWHYLDMSVLFDISTRRGAISGNYAYFSGVKQDLFIANQCIASGVKMMIWFIGGPMGRDNHKWNDNQELVKVAAEIRPLYKELMAIGMPTNVYSTVVTKTHDNKPIDKPAVPRWFKGFPSDFWTQVSGGEAMLGFFKYPDGTDAIFAANHNAFAPQKITLQIKPSPDRQVEVELLDRKTSNWHKLVVLENTVSFDLADGAGELLRVRGAASLPIAREKDRDAKTQPSTAPASH